MAPAGGGDVVGESGGPSKRRRVVRSAAGGAEAGQSLGVESGSGKSKNPVMSKECLEVRSEDSQRIIKEIEDLKSVLDEDLRQLGYCEENEKLRAELSAKVKEIHCLKKRIEELEASDSLRKQHEELEAINDGLQKRNVELQAKNDGLRKRNVELQAKNNDLIKGNEEFKRNMELQAKNDDLTKQNKELQAKHNGLTKGNEELEAINDGLRKRNVELQAKNDDLTKQNKELQAKNNSLTKGNEEFQAINDGLRKRNVELQAKNGNLTKQNKELQAKNNGLTTGNEEFKAINDGWRKRNVELQVKNDDLTKQNKELQAKNNGLTKGNEELQAKNNDLHKNDLETKKNATKLSISRLEEDIGKLHEAYNEEMCNLRRRAHENALRIFQENENLRIYLENKRSELNIRAKELEKMSAENANDRKTLDDEKQKAKYDNGELELASIEQQRADADVLKPLADQEREKEDVFARMLQLEKELHEKQQLELEVERLDGTLQVMKHLEGDDDGGDIHGKMEKLSERLERERKRLERLSGDLVTKERESNDELQQARKELIKGLADELDGRTAIGIKRMGELDEKLFLNACKRKYVKAEYQMKAAELVTHWQEELKNPSWHPFKMVQVNGEDKEILVDDDAKLKYLWIEFGDDVCNAVKTALMEMNESNPSGRYIVPELWNFRKGRKATMKEVLKYLFSQIDTTATKRRRG